MEASSYPVPPCVVSSALIVYAGVYAERQAMGKLTALSVRRMVTPGTYGDGGGLYLQVRGVDRKSWLFRFKLHRRGHLMGLGALRDVTLAEAREAATAARRLVRSGVNPIERRRLERAKETAITFRQVADAYITAHEVGWRNAKHRAQWSNTLASYAHPILGPMPVASIDTGAVMRCLEPIWREKPETASRVRGRIESVLDFASARGWRAGDNPARWRGHLDNLLPARSKVARAVHHPALPWREVGAFMASLATQEGVSGMALRFAILTATRTGETLGARWSEIDLAERVWTIPGARMKAGREHRVPLSDAAVAVLTEAGKLRADPGADGFVFLGGKVGKPLSDMALLTLLRRMGRGDLTAHGFRSTFRDWCGESTNHPREVAEAALAHTIKDKAEAAYARGDLMEKRRRLMADWGTFCGRVPPAGDVVPIRGTA